MPTVFRTGSYTGRNGAGAGLSSYGITSNGSSSVHIVTGGGLEEVAEDDVRKPRAQGSRYRGNLRENGYAGSRRYMNHRHAVSDIIELPANPILATMPPNGSESRDRVRPAKGRSRGRTAVGPARGPSRNTDTTDTGHGNPSVASVQSSV